MYAILNLKKTINKYTWGSYLIIHELANVIMGLNPFQIISSVHLTWTYGKYKAILHNILDVQLITGITNVGISIYPLSI